MPFDPRVQLINRAMGAYRGDDLYRARFAFERLTPAEMQQQHGQSGKTRQQILDEYQQQDNLWMEAMELLMKVLPK